MKLNEDPDLKKFFEKIKILEYIHNNNPCSTREIKAKFNISKTDLYRKIDEWKEEGLLIKDYNNKERKYYSHFVIRRTPQLKIELLSLYNELIELFSKKYKEIADINQILKLRKKKSEIGVIKSG